MAEERQLKGLAEASRREHQSYSAGNNGHTLAHLLDRCGLSKHGLGFAVERRRRAKAGPGGDGSRCRPGNVDDGDGCRGGLRWCGLLRVRLGCRLGNVDDGDGCSGRARCGRPRCRGLGCPYCRDRGGGRFCGFGFSPGCPFPLRCTGGRARGGPGSSGGFRRRAWCLRRRCWFCGGSAGFGPTASGWLGALAFDEGAARLIHGWGHGGCLSTPSRLAVGFGRGRPAASAASPRGLGNKPGNCGSPASAAGLADPGLRQSSASIRKRPSGDTGRPTTVHEPESKVTLM